MKPTDIRIKDCSLTYSDYQYRSPIKFGGVALDRATILDVKLTVETGSGQVATGFGSMPMGNIWAYPSRNLKYEQTLDAMKVVADRTSKLYLTADVSGHPIEISHQFEPTILGQLPALTEELQLTDPIPALAALVAASPFDAALHDAYGKAHQRNCYQTYGSDFLSADLGHFLGEEFAGETLDRYVLPTGKPRMPLYHLVGALDPLVDEDVTQRLNDGLPNTLGEWILRDGLTHLKIKLNGDDLNWDVQRVLGIDRVAGLAQAQRGVSAWFYSLDFNERCQSVSYLIEFLKKIESDAPEAYQRIQYIEQPTARDLKADRANVMHEAARLRPVVIDESLVDLETLQLAREMGYTGVAFKACKGQSQTLLLAAAAQKYGLFRCVQDLTCVGASLIHSAGIASHIPGVAAIESNGRQYCPAANEQWESRFPGVFTITDGTMNTAVLDGIGLGATPTE